MGTFDRSAFKATKTASLKEQQDEAEEVIGSKKGGRADFLKLVHGKNKVRILPGHPGTPSFCYPKTVHFLEVLSKYKKDGEDVEELKRKPIFNAKVHGGLTNDPIDAYIDKAWKLAFEKYPDDEKARVKFLSPITNYKTGIKSGTRWVVYAKIADGDTWKLGRLELPVTVKDRLNEISIDSDDEDDVIATDPFSGPDDGRVITITYNKDAEKPADYYKASIDLKKATPLTDEDLEWLAEQPQLEKLLVGSYTQKDFDMAIEGLERFDKANSFEIFSYDDFLDTLEEIAKKVPAPSEDSDDDDEEDEKPAKKSKKEEAVKKSKKAEEKSDLPFDTELEEMTMDELKGIIRREKLDIRILSKYTEEDVVEMIKEERELQEEEAPKKSGAKASKKKDPIDDEDEDEEEEEEAPRRRRSSRLADLEEDLEEEE